MKIALALAALSGVGALTVSAQDGTKPAQVLTIYREVIKEGRNAAHEKVEADFAAMFRKANFPAHYIALTAMSGGNEVWFVQPAPSFAATEEWDQAAEKEPMKTSLAAMSARDGELRASSSTLWAVHRPDLSYGVERFNRTKLRYVNAAMYRAKLGHEDDLVNAAKQIFAAYEKANVDLCILGYQVTAGAPSGTFLLFTAMRSLTVLDGAPDRMKALKETMGEDYSRLMKSSGDTLDRIESTLFRVSPGMSYPLQEMIDADPAFWKPKPAAAAKPAVSEKKPAQ